MNEVRLSIEGMDCGGCVGAVERALRQVPGVVAARADLTEKRATAEVADTVSPQRLVDAVRAAGYEAEVAG